MSTSTPLVLGQKHGVDKVDVHPLVLFNILDHYIRRNEGQERVIGTLLGVSSGANSITVTNSFPVPHSEGEQVRPHALPSAPLGAGIRADRGGGRCCVCALVQHQVAVDTEFHQTMFDLHQSVNKKEQIVGWYATGVDLNVMSVLVHDFYGRSCEQPIHLTVDSAVSGGSMGLKSYVSSAVSLAGRSFGSQFREVGMKVMPFAPEAATALSASEQRVDALTAPAKLHTELDGLKASLKKLGQLLTDACAYVDKVNSGEIAVPDRRIGRMLGDAIARIPCHSGADFEKVFTDNIQDMLMVAYLANLTKAQLALTEKLQVMGLTQRRQRRGGNRGDRGRDGDGGGKGDRGKGGDGDGGGGGRRGGGGGGGPPEDRGPPPYVQSLTRPLAVCLRSRTRGFRCVGTDLVAFLCSGPRCVIESSEGSLGSRAAGDAIYETYLALPKSLTYHSICPHPLDRQQQARKHERQVDMQLGQHAMHFCPKARTIDCPPGTYDATYQTIDPICSPMQTRHSNVPRMPRFWNAKNSVPNIEPM